MCVDYKCHNLFCAYSSWSYVGHQFFILETLFSAKSAPPPELNMSSERLHFLKKHPYLSILPLHDKLGAGYRASELSTRILQFDTKLSKGQLFPRNSSWGAREFNSILSVMWNVSNWSRREWCHNREQGGEERSREIFGLIKLKCCTQCAASFLPLL